MKTSHPPLNALKASVDRTACGTPAPRLRRAHRQEGFGAAFATAAGSLALLAPHGGALAHALDPAPGAAGAAVGFPWSFDPLVLVCLLLSAALYAIGLARLWARAGIGRGATHAQVASFCGGWLTLVVALVSPLDPLGGRLFTAHMIQHELLMIVAAPLFVLGRPLGVWVWALPLRWRRAIGAAFRQPLWRRPWRLLTAPLAAWTLHALALWLWHVPAFFEAALHSESVHTIQHSSFLLTALLFWWTVLVTPTRKEEGIALVSLFTTMLHMGALGALLTLAPTVWYPSYLATAQAFRLTALQDQQLGGLIMWVPSGLIYLICMIALAARWLNAPPRWTGARPPAGAAAAATGHPDENVIFPPAGLSTATTSHKSTP